MKLLHLILIFYSVCGYAQHNYQTIKWKNPAVGQMMLMPIYYEIDYPRLRPHSREFLDSLAPRLILLDSFIFSIESYTDCRSSRDYNRDISQRKADSIVAYLNYKTNNRLHLKSLGGGEDSLVNDCSCEGSHKSLETRYYQDTIDGQIFKPFSWGHTWKTDSFVYIRIAVEVDKGPVPYLKNGQNYVPCDDGQHWQNQRTVLRIIGVRKN